MINVWFTSDFHLGHRNIIRYCNRPFDSIEDMDATLLANLNRKVGENDVLYFLGDFCLGDADQAKLYRDRIVCRNIHMIEGNHDTTLRALAGAFCSWNQLAEIRVGGQRIVLCHYAMRVWHQSSRGVWHLYGHSHGNLLDEPTSLSIDVGVDSHDFQPWHFHEIRKIMEAKQRARELRDDGTKDDQEQHS
jgi:calcineurin-like phosphoesterase family protein